MQPVWRAYPWHPTPRRRTCMQRTPPARPRTGRATADPGSRRLAHQGDPGGGGRRLTRRVLGERGPWWHRPGLAEADEVVRLPGDPVEIDPERIPERRHDRGRRDHVRWLPNTLCAERGSRLRLLDEPGRR